MTRVFYRKLIGYLRRILMIPMRGADVSREIKSAGVRLNVIFDVGANKGQTLTAFLKHHKSAKYFCFEPVDNTFEDLKRRVERLPNVKLFNCALGSTTGKCSIALYKKDVQHTIDTNLSRAGILHNSESQNASLRTVDEICAIEEISEISFLKIDTEGYDLEVLKGAEAMISAGKVKFIQVEAGVNKDNKLHVNYGELLDYLLPFGYKIFGFYDQFPEPGSKLVLRRVNIVLALLGSI